MNKSTGDITLITSSSVGYRIYNSPDTPGCHGNVIYISQCHAWLVAIYSNMTHFPVGQIDEVSVCCNGGIDDDKSTRA